MAYKRRHSRGFVVISRPDLALHPCVQVLDITTNAEPCRIINFYHDVNDRNSLHTLLSMDLDPTIPTLVIGDFNTHSPHWSPREIAPSPWSRQLEEWTATQLLQLANEPGCPTWHGSGTQRPSTIDLAWFNDATILHGTFSGLTIDDAASYGSDHSALHLTLFTDPLPILEPDPDSLGYIISDRGEEEWIKNFPIRELPFSLPLPTVEEIESTAAQLTTDLGLATAAVFPCQKAGIPKGSPWWNDKCASLAEALHDATTPDEKKITSATLRTGIRLAKCAWADRLINDSNLWDVAKWRHGRRVTCIPAL
jgi:hypothetical protein